MRLGPYELVTLIGAGGMGEVWAAHRVSGNTAEIIAVKRLPDRLADDPAYRRILLAEARLAMLLHHPNIIHVFDAGEVDEQAYIAMEFIHGLDLSRLRKLLEQSDEHIDYGVSAYIIGEVLQGLDYAHNLVHDGELLSLIHRDVSPHNVILSTQGIVKLTDYGVARLSSEDTSGTHVKGKARYMPPEQLRGESRAPTIDLFAAGAVLHELLDGAVFRGGALDDARLLGMAIDGVIPPLRRPRSVPPALDRLRASLLDPDPGRRVTSASEALALLHDWPGYRDASEEVGALVQRHLERAVALEHQPTQTGLAHQATFLQTNDAIELQHRDPGLEEFDWLDNAGEDDLDPEEQMPSRPPSTGPHLPVSAPTSDRSPSGASGSKDELAGSGLELSTPQASFARHVATSPNPTLPHSTLPRRLGIAAVVLGLGAGAWFGAQVLLGHGVSPPPPPPPPGLRKARVIGADFAGYAGFRDTRMDKLTSDANILYRFVRESDDPTTSPLAALASGEAEFVLTTLDQLLLEHARGADASPGKIVAIIDVSIGGDALVLDSAEHSKLRSLEDLPKIQASLGAGVAASLAYARGSPSEYLHLHLDALLASIDPPALQTTQLDHAQAVYDALVATADDAEDGASTHVVAGLLWEPWVSKAVSAGMTVAASTRDLPYAVVDVLVASERVLETEPDLVVSVVERYYQIVDAQLASPDALTQQVARDLGLTELEAKRAISGLCILDAQGAASWLPSQAGSDGASQLAATVDATWSTLRLAGRVDGPTPKLDALLASDTLLTLAKADDAGTAHGLDDCLSAHAGLASEGASQALGSLELPAREAAWFVPKTATLSAERAGDVAELAARLRAFNPNTVQARLTGFGEGNDGAARKLGQARALALADALRDAGVELEIDTKGVGKRGAPTTRVEVRLLRVPEQ